MIKKIENYQLKELKDNKLYINIYNLDLKYNYELSKYWKELFFDITQKMVEIKLNYNLEEIGEKLLFNYLKDNYNKLIKDYNLNIDIRDYIEINDYISYEEWSKDSDNGIGYFIDGIYLIQK